MKALDSIRFPLMSKLERTQQERLHDDVNQSRLNNNFKRIEETIEELQETLDELAKRVERLE